MTKEKAINMSFHKLRSVNKDKERITITGVKITYVTERGKEKESRMYGYDHLIQDGQTLEIDINISDLNDYGANEYCDIHKLKYSKVDGCNYCKVESEE